MTRFPARWLALGCILTTIVIAANVIVTYRNTEKLHQSAALVAGTHDVLSALSEVLSLAKDAESGQRGYIITGEETYLEPFNTAVSSLNRKVDELEYLTVDNPEQRARIPALRSTISAKVDEMNRTIIVRRIGGANDARAVVLSGQGKIEMDALRAIVGEMTSDEQARRNENLAVSDKAFQAAISEGLFSGIIAIIAIVVIFLLLRRHSDERERSAIIIAEQSETLRTTLGEQRDAQQQIVTTLESITDGFMRYDKDWRIVYVNAEAERINRLTRSEMLERNVWEVFPALVGTHFESEFRRAVAEQVTVEFENHYEPFGRWYSVKGYPTADGGLITYIRDITTQKEAEIALRTSEERLAFVRRSSGVGFWYCDLPFDVLEWDELVKAHFHLPLDAEVTIDTFYERIHPDDREPTREAIEQSISSRTHYDTNYRTVNPSNGDVTWVRAIGRTFYSDDGTPTRFDGVTLDVSVQKRAEREIVRLADESERQRRLYETVLTNTPDFVYVFSLDHKVVYANDALIKMWGKGYEGAIGRTFLEIGYEPWHAEMHDGEIDQVAATKQPIRGEVPFTGTNGTRQYDYIFVPIIGADGEVEAVAGTTRDVTERKEAEDQLRRNHDTFFALIENNPFGVYVVDADFRLRQVSLGAQKVFETIHPLLGRDFTDILRTLWPEPFASEAISRFRHTLDTGEPYTAPSTIERRVDISVVEAYDWRIERITLPDGRYGVVCYFYDLSERQQWEATLRGSEERLRLATNAAELGIWTWHPEGDGVAWENDRPYEIFALDRSEPPVTVARFKADFLHADDIETFETAFGRALEINVPLLCECRIRRTDGQTRWVEFTGRVIDGDENYRLIGTVQDITNRKHAEEEIKALSDYNRNVLESISDPLFTVDHEWQFTYMSGAAEQLLGYGTGEVIGKNLWEEFPGVVGSEFETPYRQAMEGVPGRVTAYYPDHKRWYEANMFPGPTGVTVYFRNVTKRIRREQNLAFLANLLKDFTSISTVDSIIRLSASRIAEYLKLSHCIFAEIREGANEAVIVYDHHEATSFDLAGTYPLDQFLEKEFEIPRLAAGSVISVDDVDEEPRSPEAAKRFKSLGIEALICAPYISDGRWMFVLAACHNEPYKWSEEEIQLLQDLSARVYLSIERARAEEKLSQARDELEVLVHERTAELAAANIELKEQAEERNRAQEERVRLLGQIISSQEDERHRIARDMHDDLGQRLTALRLHLESVGGLGENEFSRSKLAEIRGIAKELDSDLSSIVWRLRPAALDDVGVRSALEDYVNKWSTIFNIKVEFQSAKFDDSSLSAEIQTVLYRITQEALNNIHKYAEAQTVGVILDKRGQDITLIVEDDGKGFELSHNNDPRKGFGLLGMSERAALVCGVVEIESAIGKGTSIFVRIPVPID